MVDLIVSHIFLGGGSMRHYWTNILETVSHKKETAIHKFYK